MAYAKPIIPRIVTVPFRGFLYYSLSKPVPRSPRFGQDQAPRYRVERTPPPYQGTLIGIPIRLAIDVGRSTWTLADFHQYSGVGAPGFYSTLLPVTVFHCNRALLGRGYDPKFPYTGFRFVDLSSGDRCPVTRDVGRFVWHLFSSPGRSPGSGLLSKHRRRHGPRDPSPRGRQRIERRNRSGPAVSAGPRHHRRHLAGPI